MGRLVEQPVLGLYHGVSTQPDNVRLPGQVASADNALFSVVSGGFEKRTGSEQIDEFSAPANGRIFTHVYRRDAAESYMISVENGNVFVRDKAGVYKTVTAEGGATQYLAQTSSGGYAFLTVGDFTFIVNRERTVQMDPATLDAPTFGDHRDYQAVLQIVGADPTYGRHIVELTDTTDPDVLVESLDQPDTISVAVNITDKINAATPAVSPVIFAVTRGSFVGIGSTEPFTLQTDDFLGDTAIRAAKDRVDNITKLPARAYHDMRVEVGARTQDEDTGYWVRFIQSQETQSPFDLSEGYWKETLAPNTRYRIDNTTMPVALVREADGTFTLKYLDWGEREVGDETIVPDPDFVGKTITDLSLHRDRLVVVSGEVITYSRAGDYFNFWPEKIAQVVDSDPFSRAASGRAVNHLTQVIPFRRALFAMSTEAQFEISSPDAFTPGTAAIDQTTTYGIQADCTPAALATELYLPSSNVDDAVVLEYYYDDSSLGGTALDVSTHVLGYIPAPLTKMVSHSTSSVLFCTTSADPKALYVYRLHWEGDKKAQSSWSRWVFSTDIHSIEVLDDHLLIYRSSAYNETMWSLERIPLTPTQRDSSAHTPHRLDAKITRSGIYDPVADRTTYGSAFPTTRDPTLWLMDGSGGGMGRPVKLTFDFDAGYYYPGDVSAYPVLYGESYTMDVGLSRIYLRDDAGSVTTGRLQLKRLSLDYQKAAEFRVEYVTPGRGTKVSRFTSLIIGAMNTLIDAARPLVSGSKAFRVKGRNDSLDIHIINDSPYPSTFTGFRWTGFFNEISRQG